MASYKAQYDQCQKRYRLLMGRYKTLKKKYDSLERWQHVKMAVPEKLSVWRRLWSWRSE